MLASVVHLAVVEAERRRDLERRQLVRAALAARQPTPGRWPALRSVLSIGRHRWFGQRVHVPSPEARPGTNVPVCC